MSITLVKFDAEKIDVPLFEAMRYMGVREDVPEITEASEEMLLSLRSVCAPAACFEEYPVVFSDGCVNIGGIISDSVSLMKNLEGCTSAVIFAATIGIGADRLFGRYSKTEPSKAVILSALGSAMIESVCDGVCRYLEESYSDIGKCIKTRFSPGYGGFDLSAQTEIAKLLETQKHIGLYFTDSMMMIPEKSVTAIVGIYEKQRIGAYV